MMPSNILAARRLRLATVAVTAVLAGCTTLPDGSRWGERASFAPGWDRLREAAVHAAQDPRVWVPLAGAAVMQIDDWDHRVSDWAIDDTPLFGGVKRADRASDDLRVAAGVGYLASVIATPGGEGGADWWSAKLRGGMVGSAAIVATSLTTKGLKDAADRARPIGDDQSFPSGHASFAAVAGAMTVRNLESIPMNSGARRALVIGADALTIATGWARIEAGAHYPSDVMVGMAIGRFFGAWFSDAFLGDRCGGCQSITVEPVPGGIVLAWSLPF